MGSFASSAKDKAGDWAKQKGKDFLFYTTFGRIILAIIILICVGIIWKLFKFITGLFRKEPDYIYYGGTVPW